MALAPTDACARCRASQRRMAPKVLIKNPGRVVDTVGAARIGGDRLSARLALPRTLRNASCRLGARAVGKAHVAGLGLLRRGWVGCDRRVGAVGVDACAGREFDLGWPRGIEERFELLEVLGEGSFGTVKAARSRDGGGRFAVKMLSKSRGKGEDWERYAAMLQKEVALWTAVQNSHDRHVARLLHVYEDEEYLYLVQEICEGGDLQKLMKDQGCLDEREAAQVISGVLSMLVACHDRNICYGDVKPANFLLKSPYPCRRHVVDSSAPKGDIVIKGVDFGCSQKLNGEGRLNKRTGTPLYMAPEIFFGWYGLEVDVWAAGMMLYQLISGDLPFFGDQPEVFTKGPKMLIVQALMDNELEMTGGVWDTVSAEVKDLISKMLDVDYNTRISARAALAHTWIQQHCKHPSILFASEEGLQMPKNSALECLNSPRMPVAGTRTQRNE